MTVLAIPNSNSAFVAASSQTGSTTDTIDGSSGGDNALSGDLIVYPVTASGSGPLVSVGANVGYPNGDIVTIYSTLNTGTGALSGLLGQSGS